MERIIRRFSSVRSGCMAQITNDILCCVKSDCKAQMSVRAKTKYSNSLFSSARKKISAQCFSSFCFVLDHETVFNIRLSEPI